MTLAFHNSEEVELAILAKIAKQRGLLREDL